jgi:hypothetical protein
MPTVTVLLFLNFHVLNGNQNCERGGREENESEEDEKRIDDDRVSKGVGLAALHPLVHH